MHWSAEPNCPNSGRQGQQRTHCISLLCSGHSRDSQSLCPWQACESRRLNMTCVRLHKPENITMAPAYETLGVCTKASSPVNARNDRHHARPWDMPRLPHAGTISPSGLRGILPCPSFKCAHVDTRACTKNIPEKMLQKTTRPSWAQLVWASEVVRAEDFSDRCFLLTSRSRLCSALSAISRKKLEKLYVFFPRYGIMKKTTYYSTCVERVRSVRRLVRSQNLLAY